MFAYRSIEQTKLYKIGALHHFYGVVASFCLVSPVWSSDFSLPFVNTSSLGVAYADWATAADDASTSYTNPAGLVKLPHKQMVNNLLGITGSAQFTGTALTPPYPMTSIAQSGVAKTPIRGVSPAFYYAAPLNNRFSYGIHANGPFGLGTHYPGDSLGITRYAAIRTEVAAMDFGASLGLKITERLAVGAGFDAMRLAFALTNRYGPPLSPGADTALQNHLHGWGYGWHAGILASAGSKTRIGFSYNSQIGIDTYGYSQVIPLRGPGFRTKYQKTSAALPGRAQLSVQHDITDRWTGMATAFYTNWRVFKEITMKNTMMPNGELISVTIPFNYHNCFDYSVGAAFKATEKLKLRAGIEFMGSPSNNHDRNVGDPVGNATILTVGSHFKATEALSFDMGIGHSFFKQMQINYSNQLTWLKGHTNTQTTVIGGQMNWNFS